MVEERRNLILAPYVLTRCSTNTGFGGVQNFPLLLNWGMDTITGNYFAVSNFHLLLDKVTSFFSKVQQPLVGQGLLNI
jgi:hypothetical protein